VTKYLRPKTRFSLYLFSVGEKLTKELSIFIRSISPWR